MIEGSIEELFTSINESSEYREYQKITNILEDNEEIKNLIEEIKNLQKRSVNLEYNQDDSYKEIDKIIDEKVEELNNNKDYAEYLRRLKEFNDTLKVSSSLIEEYVTDKVSI